MIAKYLLLGFALLVAPAWAANKCVGIDGSMSFQDAPCAGDQKNMSPEVAVKQSSPTAVMRADDVARSFEKQMESPENLKKAEKAIERRQYREETSRSLERRYADLCGDAISDLPTVGMTEQWFMNCTTFGRRWEHARVNETTTQFGVSKQFVYPRGAPLRYVYTERGSVTALGR